jgi:simple sugar transport system ATP-binding protein
MNQDNHNLLLEMQGITKTFGNITAIKTANMTLQKKEVLALLGDNGAGKTTLVKVLQGYYPPTKGKIVLENQPVQFNSPAEARLAGIETVPQDLGLVPLMSIYRNFFLGREITRNVGGLKLLDHKIMRQITTEALAKIGIYIRDANEAVGKMSGGERQAIAICRAEYFGAKLVILDEPTSALSVKQTQQVLDYIVEAKNRGLSIIFITHNMFHAHSVADRITVMRLGSTVAENLTPSEISVRELGQIVMGELLPGDCTEMKQEKIQA